MVSLLDLVQRKTVGDERRGVDLAFRDKLKYLRAIATVYAAGLEGEILAIHVGKGKELGTIVESDDRDNGVGTGAAPGQLEGVVASGHLDDHVGTAMGALFPHECLTILGACHQDFGIMLPHEAGAPGRPLAYDDLPGAFQHDAKQGTYACRAGPDDKYRVLLLDFGYSCRPKAGGQDIAHEKRLLVAHVVRDAVQSLVGVRHPDIFRLSAIDAAA